MIHFTYPIEKYDESNLSKNIITSLITKHQTIVTELKKKKAYYDAVQPILDRTRENNAPNTKIVCNHAKDISDTATGYFMGNPITYATTGDEDIEKLLIAFDYANVDDVDSDNALDDSIYGRAYEYVYMEEDGTNPLSKNVSPENTFIVCDDTIEENELFGVYYYEKRNDAENTQVWVATITTEHYIYETTLSATINEKEEQFIMDTPTIHFFGEPTIIEYLNNKDGIGDFEQQMSLIDAYNILMSDRVTDKEQFIDAILVLYGVLLSDEDSEEEEQDTNEEHIEDEAVKRLKRDKILELPTDAKAEYLSRSMDENGAEILRKALKEDIYTFSHVPNLSDENFAGNSSGVAMEYKLLGLEMITKTKTRYYKKGLRKRIRLYCNILGMQAISMEAGSIVPTFSRGLPKNLQELSTIVMNLKDTVSQETLLSLLPFVEDPAGEVEKVAEQKAESVRQQQELFNAGLGVSPNTPPEDTDDNMDDEAAGEEDIEEKEEPEDDTKEKPKEKEPKKKETAEPDKKEK